MALSSALLHHCRLHDVTAWYSRIRIVMYSVALLLSERRRHLSLQLVLLSADIESSPGQYPLASKYELVTKIVIYITVQDAPLKPTFLPQRIVTQWLLQGSRLPSSLLWHLS